jgi:hypothetical protein
MQSRRLSVPNIGDYIEYKPIKMNNKTPVANNIIIGVLGSSAYYNEDDINQLTQTIIDLWGRPSKILLEPKGTTSMFIDSWAERQKIEVMPIEAEWAKYGRRACILVSNKIEKEANHIIIIRSPKAKSDKMLQKAETLSKTKNVMVLMGRDPDTNGLIIDQYEQISQLKTSETKIKNMTLANWVVKHNAM